MCVFVSVCVVNYSYKSLWIYTFSWKDKAYLTLHLLQYCHKKNFNTFINFVRD